MDHDRQYLEDCETSLVMDLSVTELVDVLISRHKETNGFENPALTYEQMVQLRDIVTDEMNRRAYGVEPRTPSPDE